MITKSRMRIAVATAAGAAAALGTLGFSTQASAAPAAPASVVVPAPFTATIFATGDAKVSSPDEIAQLDGKVFVAYQNGVGPKGEPSKTGQKDSTVVEYNKLGAEVAHWNLTGKVEGMAADPRHERIIATVNSVGNSSIYTIAPERKHDAVKHYHYSSLPHGGGTAGVAVHDGAIYVSASHPTPDAQGSTAGKAAVYKVTFSHRTAKTTPVFDDNITATDTASGKTRTVSLGDPESSSYVPDSVPGFGGTLMLNGQRDTVFVKHPGKADQSAVVLPSWTTVDHAAFASSSSGTLYVADSMGNDVVAITGPWTPGWLFATDGSLLHFIDTKSGADDYFGAASGSPKGMLFVPSEGVPSEK